MLVDAKSWVRAGFFLCVAIAACGGGDDEQVLVPGIVSPTDARTSVDRVNKITAAMSSMSGTDAIIPIEEMIRADQYIVTGGTGLDGLQDLVLVLAQGMPVLPDRAICTATQCTFTNYGYGGIGSGYTINGTIIRSGETDAFDLSYNQVTHAGDMRWVIDGSITTTVTGIDGHLHLQAVGRSDLSQLMNNVTWDIAVDYNAITLDAQGCPIGGSVHAITSYDAMTAHALRFYVEGHFVFPPTCSAAP